MVVSHFNENLDWLELLTNDGIPHTVYTRSENPSIHHHKMPINKGREAVADLQYIVDHYPNLSSLIAFVHGHRTYWHQQDPSDIVTTTRALQWNKYTYTPLTSAMTYATFQEHSSDKHAEVNYELWRDVYNKKFVLRHHVEYEHIVAKHFSPK
ncbi:unnamed protein product [Rotaria magnacalcarata]|uniref:Uncharacterized protein n=1 Tax=Rotaria magnacalcarata TaxID=392030 RepID=A0A816QM93_9BILA|nr:unnamed protein product [Rotaria magnacalcarata]